MPKPEPLPTLSREELLAVVAEPKPPGRKPGTGTFHDRETPPPEAIPEPLVEVQVTQEACPAWGGTGRNTGGLGLYDRHPRSPATAGNTVPRTGLSRPRVRRSGADLC